MFALLVVGHTNVSTLGFVIQQSYNERLTWLLEAQVQSRLMT